MTEEALETKLQSLRLKLAEPCTRCVPELMNLLTNAEFHARFTNVLQERRGLLAPHMHTREEDDAKAVPSIDNGVLPHPILFLCVTYLTPETPVLLFTPAANTVSEAMDHLAEWFARERRRLETHTLLNKKRGKPCLPRNL